VSLEIRALALLLVLCANATATPQASEKLQPADGYASLSSDPQKRYDFIVSVTDAFPKGDLPGLPESDIHRYALPFISAFGLNLTKLQAATLAKRNDVTQVWFVPDSLYLLYRNIIAALDREVRTLPKPSVVNLSLGPGADLLPMPGRDDEPMSVATKKASDNGLIIVMAIGNYGMGDDGIVNPWCHPEWVICVGAASSDAKTVWPASARGVMTDPRTWPDVVANGINVISTWPTNLPKSEDRKQADESNLDFQRSVPKEKWDLYSIDSGTSEATPQVSRAAALIVSFVQEVAATKQDIKPHQPLFTIQIPQDRFKFGSKRGPRLTGDVKQLPDGEGVEVSYRLVEPWRLVKQLLMDSAVPMPNYGPNVVGAGFVDPGYVEKQFPTSTKTKVMIDPVRVVPN
jgi:Subtilase family